MALGWRSQYARYRSYFLNVLAIYKQKPDVKMFLEIILSLITISFFGVFALRPTVLTIANLLTEIKEKESVVVKMDTKIANLEKAQNTYLNESFRLPIITSSVPLSAEPEKFVRQVEALAAKNSVRVLGMSIGETTIVGKEDAKKKSKETSPLPEDAKSVDVSISLTGSYSALSTFASELLNLRRPVKIDLFGFNSSQAETGASLVLVISGRTPYLGSLEQLKTND